MADEFLLYISAAFDLYPERDLISRAVVEIPTSLGWRIQHTPHPGEIPDLEAVARADAHLLLIGGDIRAPIGMEWHASRQVAKKPHLLLNKDAPRTPAAQVFVREMEKVARWELFANPSDLRRIVLQLLASKILEHAAHFRLSDKEFGELRDWQNVIKVDEQQVAPSAEGEAGESSIIFSPERYTPSEGVLLEPSDGENAD